MRIVFFCHSLLSDWNHGNAHFLRGVVTELALRGHDVRVFEPADAWSMQNLLAEPLGREALEEVRALYPHVAPERYALDTLDLDRALDGAHLVIVHEWSAPELVKRLGERRVAGGTFRLLFHDTHHRSVSAREEMARYELTHYDGVLAFGEVIRRIYLMRDGRVRRGRGTRPPIRACSARGRRWRRSGTWSGWATGVMRSAPRSSMSSCWAR
jgi:spore maturation protein CgeB